VTYISRNKFVLVGIGEPVYSYVVDPTGLLDIFKEK